MHLTFPLGHNPPPYGIRTVLTRSKDDHIKGFSVRFVSDCDILGLEETFSIRGERHWWINYTFFELCPRESTAAMKYTDQYCPPFFFVVICLGRNNGSNKKKKRCVKAGTDLSYDFLRTRFGWSYRATERKKIKYIL